MVLVDYSSGSDSASDPPAPAKRRKTSASASASTSTSTAAAKQPPLPPLPAAFHDLYASTVRVSTVDDPSLHQGRKRVNPHKIGNWPSHLYVDVRPTNADRSLLEDLVARITARLAAGAGPRDSGVTSQSHNGKTSPTGTPGASPSAEAVPIHTFLSSDLGAPQPLHISLSRPLSLQTAQKESFLEKAREAVSASGLHGPFKLRVLDVYWHRTRESERSFLVLKIASADHPSSRPTVATSGGASELGQIKPKTAATTTNPELQALLARFNALATEFGQPQLYAITPKANIGVGNADGGHGVQEAATTRDAFHVSIAWSPAIPTPRIRSATAEVAAKYFPAKPRSQSRDEDREKEGGKDEERGVRDNAILSPYTEYQQSGYDSKANSMTFLVDAIKLKIGNVITSLSL